LSKSSARLKAAKPPPGEQRIVTLRLSLSTALRSTNPEKNSRSVAALSRSLDIIAPSLCGD
jgi:hypothetical protein